MFCIFCFESIFHPCPPVYIRIPLATLSVIGAVESFLSLLLWSVSLISRMIDSNQCSDSARILNKPLFNHIIYRLYTILVDNMDKKSIPLLHYWIIIQKKYCAHKRWIKYKWKQIQYKIYNLS